MAVMWVQYWGYLPAIVEEPMVDRVAPPGRLSEADRLPSLPSLPSRLPSDEHFAYEYAMTPASQSTSSWTRSADAPVPALPAPQPQPSVLRRPAVAVSHLNTPDPTLPYSQAGAPAVVGSYGPTDVYSRGSDTPYNMTTMSSSLPDYHTRAFTPFSQQHPLPSTLSSSSMLYQAQPHSQFAGQTALTQPHAAPNWIPMQYQGPHYAAPFAPGTHFSAANPMSHGYATLQTHPQLSMQAGHNTAHYAMPAPSWSQQYQTHLTPYHQQSAGGLRQSRSRSRSTGRHTTASTTRRASLPLTESFARQHEIVAPLPRPAPILSGLAFDSNRQPQPAAGSSADASGPAESSQQALFGLPHPSVPRGPPRKPKQSGHALWVGNLPPATNVIELKDYFSRDAKRDIESVFLISKSNCAFVNYRTEEACLAAMTRFHDSRFKGVRLVCRLRRVPKTASGEEEEEPDPAARQQRDAAVAEGISSPNPSRGQEAVAVDNIDPTTPGPSGETRDDAVRTRRERFFVVKSLTVEDLESSLRHGVWATQKHNEATLNEAYASGATVYLIFSANKSGEYFGYARMASAIDDNNGASISWAPRTYSAEDTYHPKAIPTPATEHAPRGQVVDDSARGTIFWEAEPFGDASAAAASGDDDSNGNVRAIHDDAHEGDSAAAPVPPAAAAAAPSVPASSYNHISGRPFRVEWLCTARLPFYRTRGLRNPWNANREVKIARDGTELETTVGLKLLDMFQRLRHAQQQQPPPPPSHAAPPAAASALPPAYPLAAHTLPLAYHPPPPPSAQPGLPQAGSGLAIGSGGGGGSTGAAGVGGAQAHHQQHHHASQPPHSHHPHTQHQPHPQHHHHHHHQMPASMMIPIPPQQQHHPLPSHHHHHHHHHHHPLHAAAAAAPPPPPPPPPLPRASSSSSSFSAPFYG